ncbi:Acetyltransferase (GNAT) family protein [Halorubrum vacuolatum]|uniref:Acetyltransferase (GNAT) family protein n=2 Tax=Halorubrum vacuolatum TaxID=63740 RepID=A0A238UUF2_HALVU|nr:Acetyltransferase (GNAT) family protein [Halorubrum vacuolatum]
MPSTMNELVYSDIEDIPPDGFKNYLDNDEVTIYLIVDEGGTIGYVILQEGHHPSRRHSDFFRIVDLYIDEDRRDRGYGKTAGEQVKELARDQGYDHIKVSCEWENEDARRFYRNTGFRPKQVEYVQSL